MDVTAGHQQRSDDCAEMTWKFQFFRQQPTKQPNNRWTIRSTVLPENLTVAQLVKKFPPGYFIRMFIAAFTILQLDTTPSQTQSTIQTVLPLWHQP